MRTRAIILLGVLVLAGCKDKTPTEYSDPDGNFKIKFPDAPKVSTKSANGITLKMYLVEFFGRGYMLGWADMPIPEWESESKTKSRLYDGRDGALQAVNGKSNLSTKSIQLADRFPGIEFGGTAEGRQLRARVYLVERRMYQLLVMARTEEDLTSPEAEEFFGSFELLEVPGSAGKKPAEQPANENPPEQPAAPDPPPPPEPAPSLPKLENWVAFGSEDGNFEVKLPAQPAKGTRKLAEVDFTVYESKSDESSCGIGFAALSAPPDEAPSSARDRLEEARDTLLKDSGGKLVWSKWQWLASAHPGQEFAARVGEKHLRGRVYLVGTRLYHLTIVGSREYITKNAADFFASFQITE